MEHITYHASVSEMSIDYIIGDVIMSVQLPLSFQE